MGLNELALSFVLNIVSKLPRNIRESIVPDMLIPPIANDPSKVQLASLGHVYFEHPDLDQFDSFAADFGFAVVKKEKGKVFYRGYGKDPFIYVASQSADDTPHFKGPAFVAKSQEEFDKAKSLPGAQLASLDDAPGGGQIVTFARADDTFFHVIFGQEEREIDAASAPSATHEEFGPWNTAFQKPRRGMFSSSWCWHEQSNTIRQGLSLSHLKIPTDLPIRQIPTIPRRPSSHPQTRPLRLRPPPV